MDQRKVRFNEATDLLKAEGIKLIAVRDQLQLTKGRFDAMRRGGISPTQEVIDELIRLYPQIEKVFQADYVPQDDDQQRYIRTLEEKDRTNQRLIQLLEHQIQHLSQQLAQQKTLEEVLEENTRLLEEIKKRLPAQ